MNTITLYHRKTDKMMSFEREILDYVLYNRILGSIITSNEVIFKILIIDKTFREKKF